MKLGKCDLCARECFSNTKGKFVCLHCYIPKNPTFGWMVSEYHRRALCRDSLYFASRGTKASLEKFLYKALDLKPVKTKKKKVSEKSDR